MAKWKRFRSAERRTLLIALAAIPAMHVLVRVVGFNRLHTRVMKTPTVPDAAREPSSALRTAVVSVHRVKRYGLFRGNCLSQSLTLAWLMKRSGMEPVLRLGVRVVEKKFDAHAWVEYDGRVLNDSQDVGARFAALTESPRQQ